MKERISAAIDQILYDNPDNEHLQRQASLIHNAQITTIDGFCAYIIRNYFHMIDLDPGYRTAEEGDLKLLREDGYIAMDRYGTVTLMEKGAEIANRIYERHTVLTKMLEGLGVSADTARCDACKMEHDVSDESFEKIKEHLKEDPLITIAQVRDMFETSRKSAKPILEYMDSIKVTKKTGAESERVAY